MEVTMHFKRKHVKYSVVSILSLISVIVFIPQAVSSDISLVTGKSTFQLNIVPYTAIQCDFVNQETAVYQDGSQQQVSYKSTQFNPWFTGSLVNPQNSNKPIDHFLVQGLLQNCKIPQYILSNGLTYSGKLSVAVSAYGSDNNQHIVFTQSATIPAQSLNSGTIILGTFTIPASVISALNTGGADIFTPINFELNPTINFVTASQGSPINSMWTSFLSNGFTGKITVNTSQVLTSGCNASGSICVGTTVSTSQPPATGAQRATTTFRYAIAYTGNGAATSGIAQPSSGGLVNITPASIVASSLSNQNPLYLFQVTPLIKPQNPITSVQSSNIVYTGAIATNYCPNGGTQCSNTIPIPSSSISAIQSQTLDSDGTIELGTGTVSVPALNSILASSGLNTGNTAQKITVTIYANGQFTGYYGTQKYIGTVNNAAVSIPLLYSSSSTTIPPVGLSGNQQLNIPADNQCTASQIVAGYTTIAGQCTPPAGTPKTCVDPQGNPDPTCTKVGSTNSCTGLGSLNPACNQNQSTYCATHTADALCNPTTPSDSNSSPTNPISSILVCGSGSAAILGCGDQPNPSNVSTGSNNGAAQIQNNPKTTGGSSNICTDTTSASQCLSEQASNPFGFITSLLSGDNAIYFIVLVILVIVLIVVIAARKR